MSAEARRLKDEINECIQGADLEWSRIVPVRRSGSSLGSIRATRSRPMAWRAWLTSGQLSLRRATGYSYPWGMTAGETAFNAA